MKIFIRGLLAGFTWCLAASLQAHLETLPAGGAALALAEAALPRLPLLVSKNRYFPAPAWRK